jgi:hypothetical protein
VFEVLYVLMLVRGVNFYSAMIHRQQHYTWRIVTTSYVIIFILWLLFYMVVYA